jgi:hypothetical protein
MRILLLSIFLFITSQCFSQPARKTIISAIVVDPDSVPIPNVAIISTKSGKIIRTNEKGFFETEISIDDSICINHIAFKRRFANEKDNGKLIILEPEVHELKQFDVTNKEAKDRKNLDETVKDIKRLAPLKTDPEYDMDARKNQFIKANGSHDKGFSPFFGPTVGTSIQKIGGLIAGTKEKRQRKKLTSHYHLIKEKK